MIPNNQQPKCPRCGSRKSTQINGTYQCNGCKALFDDDPDEGGTHSDWNAGARIDREERNRSHHNRRR